MHLLPLLYSILAGVVYSIAGFKWSWMRSYLICPLILVVMLLTHKFSIVLLYPLLLMGSFAIGYGYNSPLQTFFRKLGVPDFQNKVITRTINGLAIAGSAIVLGNLPLFVINLLYFVSLYVYLGVWNPLPARYEEGVIGMISVLIPFYMIW